MARHKPNIDRICFRIDKDEARCKQNIRHVHIFRYVHLFNATNILNNTKISTNLEMKNISSNSKSIRTGRHNKIPPPFIPESNTSDGV